MLGEKPPLPPPGPPPVLACARPCVPKRVPRPPSPPPATPTPAFPYPPVCVLPFALPPLPPLAVMYPAVEMARPVPQVSWIAPPPAPPPAPVLESWPSLPRGPLMLMTPSIWHLPRTYMIESFASQKNRAKTLKIYRKEYIFKILL